MQSLNSGRLSAVLRRQRDDDDIVLCERWYLRYKLSYRDLVEMMAECRLEVAHTTIMRWVQLFVPEFEKRWNRFACPAGRSRRVDETYVKIKGRWTYLYRAVDKEGKTVDFIFPTSLPTPGRLPYKITLDGYQASHRAAQEVLGKHSQGKRSKLRSSKYLNTLIEQDHLSIKCRLGPMLGFKQFRRKAANSRGPAKPDARFHNRRHGSTFDADWGVKRHAASQSILEAEEGMNGEPL